MTRALLFLIVSLIAAAPVGGQSLDKERAFRQKRDLVIVKSARRHYDIAEWCWKNDLLSQSTAEILYALEISDQRHKPSKTALAEMRKLDDDFWTKDRKPPHPIKVKTFHRKVEQAREHDLRQDRELAVWAYKTKLPDEARGVYERILRQSGDAIETDKDGCIQLPKGEVPADLSTAILEGAVSINGRLYLRDEFLSHLPELGAIFEAESETLRVRTPLGEETARDLHALCTELMPELENYLRGRPTRRVELFVFASRTTYEAWLDDAGMPQHKGSGGVADRKSQTALVCAQGKSADDVRALALHELTHLFHYGITRGVLPEWYEEGLAETFGGQGTYQWDGEKLELGGLLAEFRLNSLRAEGALLPLEEFLKTSTARIWDEDRQRAANFYAQSWAFVRFLRSGAGDEIAHRFLRWERMCTGAALGAEALNHRSINSAPARELFDQMFGDDLERLESEFRAYIAQL